MTTFGVRYKGKAMALVISAKTHTLLNVGKCKSQKNNQLSMLLSMDRLAIQ